MAISLTSVVARSGEQASCDLDGEVVAVNLASGRYYGLNPLGARVWDLLEEAQRVADMRDTLLAEYDVDAARCDRDLLQLLEQLAGAGLIEVRA